MFTGIVTDMGEILGLTQAGDLNVQIGTSYDVSQIDIGASIACDGVCLTVVDLGREPRNWFMVQASAETLSKTNLDTSRMLSKRRGPEQKTKESGAPKSAAVERIASVTSRSRRGTTKSK